MTDTDTATATDRRWSLTLYVAGASPRSAEAIDTVRRICDEELAGRVELTIVDVGEHPAVATGDDIVAVPTLVKRGAPPVRRLVGNLADADRVRAGLDLGTAATGQSPPAGKAGRP